MNTKPNRFRFRIFSESAVNSETMKLGVMYEMGHGTPLAFSLYHEEHNKIPGHDKYHIMQSTGLCDSKGVEIFEGDILKISAPHPESCLEWNDSWDGAVFDVKWNAEWASWEFMSMDGGWSVAMDSKKYPCTVIGNIYENKELLKELL